MFRYPALAEHDYISLYEMTSEKVWTGGETERNDFAMINAYLQNHAGGSILDIGCYSGGFIASLPDRFKKFGVEPSNQASKSASSKGVKVLGKTLEELNADQVFDVVISIDVIEHVLDVEKFLNQALAHVKEGGLLIISTGDPDSLFWRMIFKSKYWYCANPEHVSFPSHKYFNMFSRNNGLRPLGRIRFRYLKIRLMKRLSMLFKYALFALFPAVYQMLKKFRCRISGRTFVPTAVPISLIGVFKDHQIVAFNKGGL